MQTEHAYMPVTLAAGATATPVINIFGNTLAGFIFPVGFEPTSITLQARTKPTATAYPVKDPVTGVLVTILSTAPAFVPISLPELASIQYFEIVTTVAPAANREIIIITRPAA
jgi:hypothetical protein